MTLPTIGFAGMTHLGINSGAGAAARGFPTVCFDPDASLIAALQAGRLPVDEPGLAEAIAANAGRMRFVSEPQALGQCAVTYIACDVPTDDAGQSDLSAIDRMVTAVAPGLSREGVVVVLCQVPPGYTRALDWPAAQCYYQVETLIFGRALERATHPERFIVGCARPESPLPAPYRQFLEAHGCPILPMRYESAELAKIGINCCLVASVTVANTLAELCERIGADWSEIAPALRLDRRIGLHAYLTPGLGLAGGNLERDLATVLRLSWETGSDAQLIRSFVGNSAHRRDWPLRTLQREVLAAVRDPVIAIWGLAYKENTHSTKNSPALALIRHLAPWRINVHDPLVPLAAAEHPAATGSTTPLGAAAGAHALAIMTPWPAFGAVKPADLASVMAGRTVIDPYRVLDGAAVRAAGLDYFTLGAPYDRVSHA